MSQQSHPYRTNRDLFSNHYLTEHLRQTEPWNEVDQGEIREAYDEIRELWDDRQDRVSDYNEAQLERNFIRPIFDILGIPFEIEETVMRNARRPDYGFFPSAEAADAAFDRENFYEEATAVADAKRWGRKLDTRGKEKRDFENPSYQIHRYLQETPTQWAVLTNGERWRLYYEPTSHRLDSYYEIDLPELLDVVDSGGDLEAFKGFYLFFRQEAFLPDRTGDCLLDDIYDESSVFAEELGEDLQENIYEAIRVLAEGFLDTNDDLGEDDLDLIHDSSLIYLYRLIFVLYAESEGRDLLPTDNEIYSGSYSLNELKLEVVENRDATQQHYQTWQTELWNQVDELFVLIDQGSRGKDIPKDDLYIPAYNGGLFRTSPDEDDSAEAQFLSNYEAGDAYLAEVIELLTRHEADEGKGKVFVDYSSLDERNLGSIYEGLLEYKLDVADEPLTVEDGEYTSAGEDDDITVEVGEVYLRTDDGERKATGSYYTPEYIVEYIVDETLGPLVDEIRTDLMSQSADTTHSREGGFADEFADRIFDLTVLDPAMGSGHFPVNAVDYLARKIIDAQEKQDRQAIDAEDAEVRAPTTREGELRDINWARRKVAQRCIYGVDVNPLATELAKVSLWLRTLAAEQPLAFLDHHLKTGNSLVGSDIEDVLSNGDDEEAEDGQLTLQQSFDHTRKRAMEHVTDRFQDLLTIDNETLEDAKEMEAVYDEVREDPLYQKLLAMANVHTADAFGLDVPDDAYERMARALHSEAWESIEEQDWFKSSQAMAEEERFFHWELEFPTAFYDQDGERHEDAGFDAVIGNPPYVRIQELNQTADTLVSYLLSEYDVVQGKFDLYLPFVSKSMAVCGRSGVMTFIIPNKFMKSSYGEGLRNKLSKEQRLLSLLDFGDYQVFEGLSTYTCVLSATPHKSETATFATASSERLQNVQRNIVEHNTLEGTTWNSLVGPEGELLNRLLSDFRDLATISEEIFQGVITGGDDHFILNKVDESFETATVERRDNGDQFEIEKEVLQPFSKGADVRRNHFQNDDKVLLYPYHSDELDSSLISEEELEQRYSGAYSYLLENNEALKARGSDSMEYPSWYSLWNPRSGWKFKTAKIVTPVIAESGRFVYDDSEMMFNGSGGGGGGAYGIITSDDTYSDRAVTAVLNSAVCDFIIQNIRSQFQGGYYAYNRQYIEDLPIPDLNQNVSTDIQNKSFSSEASASKILSQMVNESERACQSRNSLNLDLLDYLSNYADGPSLPDIGLFQPTGSNILDATTEEYDKLQIERARTTRDGSTVTIEATARYKPEDEEEFETDTYGYTETEFFEAFTLTDQTNEEAALVEAFVPVAVDEEIGGFRDNATKNNSLIDRLKDITLPDPDDVADDLRRYIETKERADELDEKIEKADQLIDEIVYDLYDLTDEEIEIVEEAVADD